MALPRLATARLVLRPFTAADADAVTRAAGDREVARTTLNIPHPYPPGAAAAWIATLEARFAAGAELALCLALGGEPIGAVGLVLDSRDARAELGYWIARPRWGQGFATEAAQALVAHGFAALGLVRVGARHFADNPASGRVMQKLGMRREGVLRRYACRDGVHHDVVVYGVLADEWRGGPAPADPADAAP